MNRRSIGGLSVSTVGLGCNQFGRKIDARQARAVIDAALDSGINYLDTADRYGYGTLPFSGYGRSEEFIGLALQGRRDQVVVATKFGYTTEGSRESRGSRRSVLVAIEESLRRLRTDYIDLYQIHFPDPGTPIEETLSALNALVEQGKVREIGCCNFADSELEAAMRSGNGFTKRFVSVQNEFSLLHHAAQQAVLQSCAHHHVAFLPYFPLASGMLTGKYIKGQDPPGDARLASFAPNRPHLALTDQNLDQVARLSQFAADRGHTLLELAFSWLLAHHQVASVAAGATTPEQVRSNVAAASWRLSTDDLAQVGNL